MIRRTLAIMLAVVLAPAIFGFQPIHAKTIGEAQLVEQVRAKIQRVGTGRDARIEVRLRDNTKLKGYVSEARDDSFTLTNSKTGATQTVAYTDVTKVKKSGGLRTRTWVIIGAAAAATVIVGIIVKPAVCDGGAQDRFPC